MKWIVALATLLTAAPSVPQEAGVYPHDEAAIVRVFCQRPIGNVTGSAFKVTGNGYITAHHVVDGGVCFVAGQRITITWLDEKHDYATFTGPSSPDTLETSCNGFGAGQTYLARGYPGGGDYNIRAPWIATLMTLNGFRIFVSSDSIPGMSGGPVMDAQGRAVGIVSMRFPARSMPLKLTGYCTA